MKILKEWDNYTIEPIDESSSELPYAMRLVWDVFLEFEANEYSDEGVVEFQTFIDYDSIRNKIGAGELSMLGSFHFGEIVGVIATRAPFHIALLFVHRTYHKHGIAKKLIEVALEECAQGVGTMHKQESGGETADEDALREGESDEALRADTPTEITVNSSPYAVDIYKHMGFEPVDVEQTVNGMRFTPMKKVL